ncbi:carboxypeptidase-like regulatory domain-containing protein [Aporhodopirellula aestuarii]|uniref:Carboxypeptidase-like regulatory domain-containing protein n=1 Tax=Aporhodopirellula aestuarii TaxID=2950107 RepID=A0ABT0TZ32_9BACT|nr:carboxypeptidase-like regulatory domain-containing protein [Aporhodopirellula aestuarii]MCM2369869.1 carboxypeptidase-like regulatory domain-containing protein [Aporhodopirellula aestuarii]
MESNQEKLLRQPWHPSQRAPSRVRRLTRRVFVTVFGFGLIGLLVYLSLSPFWHPNTYWAAVSETAYSPESGLPLMGSFTGETDPFLGLFPSQQGQFELDELSSPASLSGFLRTLQVHGFENSDSLVLYVRARGMVIAGEPVLVCRDFNVANPGQGVYAVADILRRIGNLRASVKLLVFETEDQTYDVRLGQVPGRFMSSVKELVGKSGRDDLWVLTSHRDWQYAQSSPALKESLFRFWFDRGLAGHADVDQSTSVDIGELHRYVSRQVMQSSSLRSQGLFVQTPELVWGGGDLLGRVFPQIVSTAGFDPESSASVISDVVRSRQREQSDDASANSSDVLNAEPKSTGATPEETVQESDGEAEEEAGALVSGEKEDAAVEPLDGEPVPPEAGAGLRNSSKLTTSQRIADSWAIIEQLNTGDAPRPIDVAPSLWCSIRQQLFWYEQALVKPSVQAEKRQTKNAIQRMHFALRRLANGEQVPESIDPQVAHFSILWNAQARSRSAAITSLIADDNQSIRKWVDANPLPQADGDEATRLLYRLAAERELDESLIRDAVSTQLLADEAKRYLAAYHGGLRERVLATGQRNLFAQRLLFDRTRDDWRQFVTEVFEDIRRQYQDVIDDLQLIEMSKRMRAELLMRLPDYLTLRIDLAGDTRANFLSASDLERLIDRLERLDSAIAKQDIELLAGTMRELSPLHFRIATDAENIASHAVGETPPNLATLELLSRSIAVSFERRSEIEAMLPKADVNFWQDFDSQVQESVATPSDEPRRRKQEQLQQNAAIELRLLQLKTRGLNLAAEWHLKFLDSDVEIFERYESLADGYVERVSAINRAFDLRSGLQTLDSYATTRNLLDSSIRAVGLVDSRDLPLLNSKPIFDYLTAAKEYDQYLLAHDELLLAQRDASDAEFQRIKQAVTETRSKINASKVGPPVTTESRQRISISGPRAVSLETQPESTLTLDMRLFADSPHPVWIVLDYDESLLEVQAADSAYVESRWSLLRTLESMRTQAEVKSQWSAANNDPQNQTKALLQMASSLGEAAEYPVDPSKADIKPSMILEINSPKPIVFKVRRKKPVGRTTKLITKIISADAYVRHETDVMLPAPPSMRLIAGGPSELATSLQDGLLLHPLPNRETSFDLALLSENTSIQTVDLTLLAIKSAVELELPAGSVSAERGADVLEALGGTEVVVKRSGVSILPNQANPLTSLLAAPPVSPDAADVTELAPPSGADPSAGESPEWLSFESDFGSVLWIEDPVTGESIFRRIAIAVQRPRRFVRPSLSYDAKTRKLSVKVAAVSDAIVPKGGINLSVHVQASGAANAATLTGVLGAPDFVATLSSIVPSSSSWAEVVIDVDGYPRAFTYRIPCETSTTSFDKQSERFDIRIKSPLAGTVFGAAAKSIPVHLEIDSPVGTFPLQNIGQDFIEVGLDMDRDREFRNENTTVLLSDRSVDLVTKLADSGMVIQTSVSDFALEIPTHRTSNLRANVLAKLVSGEKQLWSEPLEVILDSAGPTITKVELVPDRMVVVDGTIQVRAVADDHDLSGVAMVEFLVDSTFTGTFSEDAKPIEGKQDDLLRWVAEVPFKELRPGSYDLLTRATDKAGNTGPVVPTPVIVTETAADPLAAQANTVSGTVTYDHEPLGSAKVTLTPLLTEKKAAGDSAETPTKLPPAPLATTTSEKGQFVFPSVIPGAYSLRVVGLARNRPRFAEQEIRVIPKPGKAIRLQLIAH